MSLTGRVGLKKSINRTLIMLFADGTLSYDMPQGEKRSSDMELNDDTYDGDRKNGYFFDGLGQLTDGELGGDNLRHDPKGTGIKGYEWVGWKNDSLASSGHAKSPAHGSKDGTSRNGQHHQSVVELLFRFDGARNFSQAFIHCFNNGRDVRVFRSATFLFALDDNCRSRIAAAAGSRHADSKERQDYILDDVQVHSLGIFHSPLVFRPSKDLMNDQRRLVTVPLENRIGNCVTLRLEFDSKWIVLSEIQFNSGRSY